ncbi:MAG: hypothetical protein U0470_07080 [Anaerolineae bacterium]
MKLDRPRPRRAAGDGVPRGVDGDIDGEHHEAQIGVADLDDDRLPRLDDGVRALRAVPARQRRDPPARDAAPALPGRRNVGHGDEVSVRIEGETVGVAAARW